MLGGAQGGTNLTNVTALAGGQYHSLARTANGSVFSWGYNLYGQLGNNSTTNSLTPVQVLGGAQGGAYLTNVTAVAGGQYHSLALTSAGTVYAWGNNNEGQLGNNSTTNSSTPVQVFGGAQGGTYLTNVTAIAGGSAHSLALTSNGIVYAWGYNGVGELGNNSTTNSSTPVLVQGLSNVVKIASSTVGNSSYALEANGSLWAWGFNNDGQLGNGNTTNQLVPVQITPPMGYSIDLIAAGGYSFSVVVQPTPEPGLCLWIGSGGLLAVTGGRRWLRRRSRLCAAG